MGGGCVNGSVGRQHLALVHAPARARQNDASREPRVHYANLLTMSAEIVHANLSFGRCATGGFTLTELCPNVHVSL